MTQFTLCGHLSTAHGTTHTDRQSTVGGHLSTARGTAHTGLQSTVGGYLSTAHGTAHTGLQSTVGGHLSMACGAAHMGLQSMACLHCCLEAIRSVSAICRDTNLWVAYDVYISTKCNSDSEQIAQSPVGRNGESDYGYNPVRKRTVIMGPC